MNFLAHIYLSGDDPNIMIGNFIADFLRGRKQLEQYPRPIIKGVELHRKIDKFTDKHPAVKEGVTRMSAYHGRYAPVIVDVFYDYLLILNWDKYSDIKLENYTSSIYQILGNHLDLMPPRLKSNLPKMITHNWLMNYGRADGLEFTFSKMKNRVRFEANLESATENLLKYEQEFSDEFNTFFPDIVSFVNQELIKIS